jgi:hypothetical protein
MNSHISVGQRFPQWNSNGENFGGMLMKSLRWHGASTRRRFVSTTANWACAVLCVLVFFCSAAQAQPSISGFLVNGVAATSGPIGANLTIQGSGFGTTQGFSTATLNGQAIAGNGVKAVSWSNTAIVVVIPTNATSGPVVVKVSGKTSNSVNFTVSPAINSLSPTSGEHGTSVTLAGANFTTQAGNTVTFNGVSTTPSSWSSTKIVAPVPWTTTGKVVVKVGSATSNGVTFTVAAPPPAGTPGTGTFFVNRTDDPAVPVDASGNPLLTQFCQNTSNTDTSSPCSLREAVVEANGDANDTSTSPDTIMLASATYHLSLAGTGTVNGTTGHLDITNPVTIVGTGASTIIQADATLQDQVFLIDAAEEGSIGFPVAISNLVIQGGQANPAGLQVTSGGAFLWEAGTDGTGQLKLTNVNLNGNTATDPGSPGLDDGGAMALFNMASVTTPAQVTITGSAIQNNQALDAGGGIALKGAISLTMSNSTVTGNKALGGGAQQGGGLFFCMCNNPPVGATSSPSFIQNSTISANIAGSGSLGEGGGVYTDQTLTINQGSVISGNSAGGAGGGIATALAGANDQVVVSSSSITGNSTSGSGGGIETDANSKANLQLSFNRIVGNSATGGGSGLSTLGTGTVTATDNWWGCNQGPQTSGNGCDTVSGTVTSNPWIVLTNTANPSVVLNGTATTLTASFLQDSSNAILSASNLTPLIGLTVSYPRTVNGTLSQQQTTIQPSGTATATLTTSGGSPASSDVKVDNATATASVTVQDFSVGVSNVTANFGSSTAQLTVTVTSSGGFNGAVALSCGTPMPAGITCGSFNPATVTPPANGSVTSILTVNIATSVGAGTYGIPVNGTSSGVTRSGSGNLTLATFTLSISPPSQTISLGQTATYTVTCSTTTGFSGPVQLSSTLGGSFNHNPVNCPGPSTYSVTPTTTGTLNFTVSGIFGTAPPVNAPNASLTVQQTILRPTVFTNGSGLASQYSNPANAADGNSSTFSAAPSANPSGLNDGDWSGFGTITGTPSQMLLKVTSSSTCDSGSGTDGAEVQYSVDGTHNNDTLIYQLGFFAAFPAPSANRALTTDVISLPVTTNPANVRVLGSVYSPSLPGCHKIYDVWIELTF